VTYYRVTIDVQQYPGDEHPEAWEWSELLDLPRDHVRYIESVVRDGNINEETEEKE